MLAKCRAEADKTMLSIDGQYSALLSILYQTKHGGRKAAHENPQAPSLHVALSVKCADGLLYVGPKRSEGLPHQIAALDEAVGEDGHDQVRAICSDAPERLDAPRLRDLFPNLDCVIHDPMHIPMKVEKATKEKRTQFSSLLRCCVCKFRYCILRNQLTKLDLAQTT